MGVESPLFPKRRNLDVPEIRYGIWIPIVSRATAPLKAGHEALIDPRIGLTYRQLEKSAFNIAPFKRNHSAIGPEGRVSSAAWGFVAVINTKSFTVGVPYKTDVLRSHTIPVVEVPRDVILDFAPDDIAEQRAFAAAYAIHDVINNGIRATSDSTN